MSETVLKPHKRILTDATMTSGNVLPNNASKKRKLDPNEPAVNRSLPPRSSGPKAFGSSQPQKKSQFEEVLEKLTQDISGLKENNAERDQQWDRPPLEDFNETRDNICFQQIDAEEGTLQGGKTTVRLFGVTEVCDASCYYPIISSDTTSRKGILSFFMLQVSSTTCTSPLR
jgi:DNA polymerase delta subunit 1